VLCVRHWSPSWRRNGLASCEHGASGGLRSLLMRARTQGNADPLLRAVTDFEKTEQAILAADVALRTGVVCGRSLRLQTRM
jgi:hypothetical protein